MAPAALPGSAAAVLAGSIAPTELTFLLQQKREEGHQLWRNCPIRRKIPSQFAFIHRITHCTTWPFRSIHVSARYHAHFLPPPVGVACSSHHRARAPPTASQLVPCPGPDPPHTITMSTRRSSRSAYKSLVELERRAKEAEASAAGPLWGEEAFADDDDDDDGSFDAERLSDDGEVRHFFLRSARGSRARTDGVRHVRGRT